MSAAKKKRGATAIRSKPTLPHSHLWAVGALSVAVAFTAILMPSDDVEANRPDAPAIAPASEPLAATADISSADTIVVALPESDEPAIPAAPPEPLWVEHTVKSGDNLSLIFNRAGYSDRDVYEIVRQTEGGKALTRIFPGQTLAFQADDNGDLAVLKHIISPLETTVYTRAEEGYIADKQERTPEVRTSWASGTIKSSLFLAGEEAGLSQNVIMDLAAVFGGVIDFALDPRVGDTMHVLYEEFYLDGKKFKDGDILAASFTNRGETFNAYRYTDSHGDINYFNEEGVSMRKAFLLAPLDFTRVSSNFNLSRLHPIYKTKRPHRGTDYAAPRGTPVYAAGDGRVTKAGYSNANGNYVFIAHGEEYVTKYLHLHKRKVRTGQRVSQSQLIGTVGSTGAATGPHLHYEFLVAGVHRNPRTIHKQLPKAKALPASEMEAFRVAIGERQTQLAAAQADTNLALAEASESDRLEAP